MVRLAGAPSSPKFYKIPVVWYHSDRTMLTDHPPPSPIEFSLQQAEQTIVEEAVGVAADLSLADVMAQLDQMTDQLFWLRQESERQRQTIERLIQILGS